MSRISRFSSPRNTGLGPIALLLDQASNRCQEFTRLWYLYQASTGDSHLVLEKLHRQYGPIVRITPSIIDVDIPELIKTIFSIKGDWLKVGHRIITSQTRCRCLTETCRPGFIMAAVRWSMGRSSSTCSARPILSNTARKDNPSLSTIQAAA